MVSETTEEERAERTHNTIMEACGDIWLAGGFSPRPLPDTRRLLKDAFRDAVGAERERAARIDSVCVTCPVCDQPPRYGCKAVSGEQNIIGLSHGARWRAAIRQEPGESR